MYSYIFLFQAIRSPKIGFISVSSEAVIPDQYKTHNKNLGVENIHIHSYIPSKLNATDGTYNYDLHTPASFNI